MSELPNNAELARLFEPLPVSRSRAMVTIVFAGLALLALGGALSYASDSPDLHGGGTRTAYWSLLFLFHALAFGGAALIGAFPRLARPLVKLGWVGTLALVCAAGVTVRWGSVTTVTMEAWSAGFRLYLPAIVPLLAGLWWRGERHGSSPPNDIAA